MPKTLAHSLRGTAAVTAVVNLLLLASNPGGDWTVVSPELTRLLEVIRFEDEILRDVLHTFFALYDESAYLADDINYLESHSKEELLAYLQTALDFQEHAYILRELLVVGRIKGYAETTAATFRAGELLKEWLALNPTLSVVGPALRSLEHSNTYGLVVGPAQIDAITTTLNTLAFAR